MPLKIGFVILKQEYSPGGEPVDIVYDWPAIQKWANTRDVITPSRNWYMLIKALERNALFISEIEKARENCSLPKDGLPINIKKHRGDGWNWRYQKMKSVMVKGLPLYVDDGPPDLLTQKVLLETRRIKADFYLKLSSDYLRDIIKHGFVDPVSDINITFHEDGLDDTLINSVYIRIRRPVTKNAFMGYIDKNWKTMAKSINKLPKILPENFLSISDRDLEIVDARNSQKLTLRKIAEDVIAPKYGKDDCEATINEDSVKTAYNRAKKKIDSLFMPKSPVSKG